MPTFPYWWCRGREGMGRPPPRSDRERSAGTRRTADARAATGEVRVRVTVCGVCRTDLHLAEGDLQPMQSMSSRATRSSESSMRSARTPAASRSAITSGSRGSATPAGRAGSAGVDDENLCLEPRFTGWDADGGYAAVRRGRRAVRLPAPAGLHRRRARSTALRRHHRVPRAATSGAARPAGGSGSTGSGRPPTWLPRWRLPRGRRSTS